MRRKSTKQMYLDFSRESSVKVVRKNRAKYEAIDRVLKANRKVVDLAHRDLSKKLSESKGGREAKYTTEQVLRALIVMFVEGDSYRDINRVDTLEASTHLRKLRDEGLLEMKGKAAATYYVPTEKLGSAPEPRSETPPLSGELGPLSGELRPLSEELAASAPHLCERVKAIGKRAPQREMMALVADLCSWKPLRPEELARILGRQKKHIIDKYLAPLVERGVLERTIPEKPTDPRQAYRKADKQEGS